MMASNVETHLRHMLNPRWYVRAEAIRKLELDGSAEAADALIEVLAEDESQFVRAAAARALGRISGAKAVPALTAALADPSFYVRQAALWALGEIGAPAEKALPALQPFTESEERFPQAELTVAELAELVVKRIQTAVEEAQAPAADDAAAADDGKKTLTADERKAKREAALARKRAREAGEDVPAPAEAAAEAPAAEAPAAEAAAPDGPPKLSPEQIKEKRLEALARKKKLQAEREAAAG